MKRTYIDASVLIAAFQGDGIISRRAMEVLDDPNRELVVSDFLRLEVLPKPTFHKRTEEVEFMNAVLENAAENVPCDPGVTKKAIELASDYDVAPMDALHVGAASAAKVTGSIWPIHPPMTTAARGGRLACMQRRNEGRVLRPR